MTPLERLIGSVPAAADYRDWSDAVATAIVEAARRDREQFVRVLLEEPTLFESGTIVHALGAVDDARIVSLLVGALRNGTESNVRWSAAHALEHRKDPGVVEAFIDALRDRAPSVRAVVIEALGDLGDRRAEAPLREALARPSNRKDDYLRKLIEAALEKLRP